MHETVTLLTSNEMAYTLEINPSTLEALVYNGVIPHIYVQVPNTNTQEVRFNPYAIIEWLQSSPDINELLTGSNPLDGLRQQWKAMFPGTIGKLKSLDSHFSPKRIAKGYSLSRVPNKKYGFLYYVRYIRNGKLIYSRWNTHTNNLKAAEQFAVDNRTKILAEYDAKHTSSSDMYGILQSYYAPNSKYIAEMRHRGRSLKKDTQDMYHRFINNVFIPFLKGKRISQFQEITPPIIAKFQTSQLEKGNKPQTVNRYFSGASTLFDHLVLNGILAENVFDKVPPLRGGNVVATGCYEIDKLKGVFDKHWNNDILQLLNMIIYTTNLRNSEIERIQIKDLIEIDGIHFIDVPASKSKNGVRIVPLHDSVYRKFMDYAEKYGRAGEDYIFKLPKSKRFASATYRKAYLELAEKMGYTAAMLKKENITFYSGRYFWKTLTNANGLGDVEEVFMGHRVSQDVAKLYNRRDKQGQGMILKKAREVFAILDEWVFNSRAA